MAEIPGDAKVVRQMRPRQRARTRGRIERAARQLFRDGGYMTCTVSDIVKLAGLSRAIFYHHFRDKRDVLEGLIRDQVAITTRKFTRSNLPPDPSDADLAFWVSRYVDSMTASLSGVRLMNLGSFIDASFGAISYRAQSESLLELGRRVPAFGLYDEGGRLREPRFVELNLIVLEMGQVAIARAYGAWPTDLAITTAMTVSRLRGLIERNGLTRQAD